MSDQENKDGKTPTLDEAVIALVDAREKKRKKERRNRGLYPDTPLAFDRAFAVAKKWDDARGFLPLEAVGELIRIMGFDLRYNVVLCRHEVNGNPADESHRPKIISLLTEFATVYGQQCYSLANLHKRSYVIDAIEYAFAANPIHPVRNWYGRISSMMAVPDGPMGEDGTFEPGKQFIELPMSERPFTKLAAHLKDRDGNAAAFLLRWMLGCIGRLEEGFQNYTLVLKGPQGIGKSTLAKWLCSVGAEYFQEGPILPSEKDHRQRLAQRWIWCADEFGETMTRAGSTALKAFQTQETITERMPYARFAQTLPRLCNIIATTNDATFLSDPTGNRRYLVVDLTHIDHAYVRDLDPNLVWADIADRYMVEGERGRLLAHEVAAQISANEDVEQYDSIEEVLHDTIEVFRVGRIDQADLTTMLVDRIKTSGARERNLLARAARQVLESKWNVRLGRSGGRKFYFGVRFLPKPPGPDYLP